MTASNTQVGGSHYKDMGDFQPWDVLKHWLTPEEYRGYQKGVAIAYLARERAKGGDQDIAKAAHHLQKLLEVSQAPAEAPADCGCQLVCGGGAGALGCKGLPTLEQAAWGEVSKKRTFIVDGAEFEAVPRGEKHQCADCHFTSGSLGDCVFVVRLAEDAGIPACGGANVFYARVQR